VPREKDIRQPRLGFLGSLGWQHAETRKPMPDIQRLLFSPQRLKMPTARKKMIYDVEHPAHGAASLQVVTTTTPCGRPV
jgi:hypothetical protein